MFSLPPIPSWQAIHPLLVHFPIALLLTAPLFIIIGALRRPGRGFPFLATALILIALGTAAVFLSASSGEAAGEIAEKMPQAEAVLDQHQDLAEITEIAFSALTLIFAAILFVPRLLKQAPNRAISTVLPLLFLVLYAAGALSLMNTAHQGGRLVHELGVTAQINSGAPNVPVESVERE